MLQYKKTKLAKKFQGIRNLYNIKEVSNIYDYIRGLYISSSDTEENYDLGCNLYNIKVRKINSKLYSVALTIESVVVEKALCNTVTETSEKIDIYNKSLLEYHKNNKEFNTKVLEYIFTDFNDNNSDRVIISIKDVKKDLIFTVSKLDYTSIIKTLEPMHISSFPGGSRVNIENFKQYIVQHLNYPDKISFSVSLNRSWLCLSTPYTTITITLESQELLNTIAYITKLGFLVTYED